MNGTSKAPVKNTAFYYFSIRNFPKSCYYLPMIGKGMEERKVNPEWIRPNLQEERGEIERVVVEFLKKELTTENINAVVIALRSATVVDLSDEEWELLENTDSHLGNVRPGHLEDAEKIFEVHNVQASPDNERNFKKTLAGFLNSSKMQTPAILRDKTGKLHLVSG